MEKAFLPWRIQITPGIGGITEICLTKPTPLRDYSWFVFDWHTSWMSLLDWVRAGSATSLTSDKDTLGFHSQGLCLSAFEGCTTCSREVLSMWVPQQKAHSINRTIKRTEDHPVPNLLQGTALSYSYFLWVSLYLLKSYLRWQWGWDKPPSNVVKKQLEKVIFFGNDGLEDLSCLTQQFCFLWMFTFWLSPPSSLDKSK